jgi:hypothetical protein
MLCPAFEGGDGIDAGHKPIRLWLVQTTVSDGLFSVVYGAWREHPSWLAVTWRTSGISQPGPHQRMFRDFVRLPVCEQCAGKVEGKSVGKRSRRSAPVLPMPDRLL